MPYSRTDFEYALTLMQCITEAAKHGPEYAVVATEATTALKNLGDTATTQEKEIPNG